ncbi:MAG: PD-(D/E)XK nuclease family protein [Clostridia bacterium]|nr:PD-(D/E)XK nuclease family protein [Clostridia bacterium]
MITLITGDFGSGKTTHLCEAIAADVAACRPACLLVPEQQTVLTEQMMADRLPPSAPLCFEVSNFTRLANTVFRRVGGLSYRYASAAARTLFMWRAMGELMPLLHEKNGEQELGRVRKMTAAMQELSALSLTPGQLDAVSRQLEAGSHLKDKLQDLSLLSTTYHALLHERYSDVADDLDRLATLLEAQDVLGGMHVYVDGFISFTAQEWRVLRAIARHCPLTVTLTLPGGREDATCYVETKDTARRLADMAALAGCPLERIDLGGCRRTASPLLRRVLPALFEEGIEPEKTENTAPVCCEEPDALRIFAVRDAFAEAELVAADIARRVKEEGARYRDFAVIARRAEQYTGILDVCLENADIPCFMSKKTDISTYRAVKLIYTAYAVCTGGWRGRDVISYLKCGMSGIGQTDCDMLELYVTRWRLNGRRFTDDTGWNMNPDGYTDRPSPRAEEILARVEAARRTLVDQLLPLQEGCRKQSVQAHCRVLYEFLVSLRIEEQLAGEAARARAAGRVGEGDELSRLYATILHALDELADILQDVLVSAEQFVDLLRLLLGEVSLSRIPTSLDEVTVGSADLLRLHEPKHIYLIGVNDGVFPAPVDDGSVFSEHERCVLQAHELPVEPDLALRSAREYFCVSRALAAASESVTVLFAEQKLSGERLKPSVAVTRLMAVSGREPITPAEGDRLAHLWRRDAAADYLGLYRGTAEGEALARCLQDDPLYARTVAGLSHPLAEADCHLSEATAASLYAHGLTLTQARIDRYVRCPFSYFCSYVLKLDPAKVIEFSYADVGNLLHAVLEMFFAILSERQLSIAALGEEERRAIVSEVLERYIHRICPAESQRTPRLLHLFANLRRMATLVIDELYEELSQSDFLPRFFELDIGSAEEDAPGAIDYRLPDGRPIRIYGRIDRVDTWQKGNKTYLRVIDYKSGPKDFSLEDVERGLDTQLLVYLFSLWKSQNPAFRRLLCEEGGELMPAGVLYTAACAADKVYDAPPESGEVIENAHRSVKRSGLLLDEEEVLRAMDKTREGRFIPVRFRADGGVHKASERSLASLEKMGELVGRLDRVICRIGSEITGGEASARPLRSDKRKHICEFCDMKAVCRSSSLG